MVEGTTVQVMDLLPNRVGENDVLAQLRLTLGEERAVKIVNWHVTGSEMVPAPVNGMPNLKRRRNDVYVAYELLPPKQ